MAHKRDYHETMDYNKRYELDQSRSFDHSGRYERYSYEDELAYHKTERNKRYKLDAQRDDPRRAVKDPRCLEKDPRRVEKDPRRAERNDPRRQMQNYDDRSRDMDRGYARSRRDDDYHHQSTSFRNGPKLMNNRGRRYECNPYNVQQHFGERKENYGSTYKNDATSETVKENDQSESGSMSPMQFVLPPKITKWTEEEWIIPEVVHYETTETAEKLESKNE